MSALNPRQIHDFYKYRSTLQGSNFSVPKVLSKMMFLFPRWDMWVSGRVDVKITHTHTLLGSPFMLIGPKISVHIGPRVSKSTAWTINEKLLKMSKSSVAPAFYSNQKKQIAKSKFLKATVGTRLRTLFRLKTQWLPRTRFPVVLVARRNIFNWIKNSTGKWPFPIKLQCQESVLHGRYDSWYDLIIRPIESYGIF